MKNRRKISISLLFVFLLTLSVGVFGNSTAYADENTIKESFKKVSEGNNTESVIGNEAKNKIFGLSQDMIDIVSTGAMAILIISCIWTGVKIGSVGDNAQKKAMLKAAVILQILGIIFLANIISFIGFSFDNLQIF